MKQSLLFLLAGLILTLCSVQTNAQRNVTAPGLYWGWRDGYYVPFGGQVYNGQVAGPFRIETRTIPGPPGQLPPQPSVPYGYPPMHYPPQQMYPYSQEMDPQDYPQQQNQKKQKKSRGRSSR